MKGLVSKAPCKSAAQCIPCSSYRRNKRAVPSKRVTDNPRQRAGMRKAVATFINYLRSSNQLYTETLRQSYRIVRLAGMVIIAVVLTGRCILLYTRPAPRQLPTLAIVALSAFVCGPSFALGVASAGWLIRTAILLARQPEENMGHRAGAQGFAGQLCENTVEALTNLIRQDNAGQLPEGGLAYVEFDVHETRDGELAVLHDLQTVLRGAEGHAMNAEALEDIKAATLSPRSAEVKDVPYQLLKALHLGGKEGVHVPTLQQFLAACRTNGIQRSVAVEVKSIFTEEGRHDFLCAVRDYSQQVSTDLEERCPVRKYPPFGWVAVIAFPFAWAPSFGEFGSGAWRHWARQFAAAGIPVRSCVVHHLDLIEGA